MVVAVVVLYVSCVVAQVSSRRVYADIAMYAVCMSRL